MKFLKVHTILTFCFLGGTTVSSQSMLEQYFGGDKESLVKEDTKLIHTSEPTFKPTNKPTEPDPAAIADMGFEQVYKSASHQFSVTDNKRIFAYKFLNQSENTIIFIHGVASSAYLYNKTAGLLQKATQAEIYAIDLRGTDNRKVISAMWIISTNMQTIWLTSSGQSPKRNLHSTTRKYLSK